MVISVITFNGDEKATVETLFEQILEGARSPWKRGDKKDQDHEEIVRPSGRQTWTLRHRPLLAQGNVVAGAALADLFSSPGESPDYVVFFGCAGALDPAHMGSVFLVDSVNYLSLGAVDRSCLIGEKVTLNNKWLCDTGQSAGVNPLPGTAFPLRTAHGSVDLRDVEGLGPAHVAATDKVVRVAPGKAPEPTSGSTYEQGPWSYAQALGHVAESVEGTVLVETESYGISTVAHSLGILDRVIVMRVTTDSLADKNSTDGSRRDLMKQRLAPLSHLINTLFRLAGAAP